MARVSGSVDIVVDTAEKTTKTMIRTVSELAIERAISNGATRESVSIAEIEIIPLQVRTIHPFLKSCSRRIFHSVHCQ
jgi:hypothetical protein